MRRRGSDEISSNLSGPETDGRCALHTRPRIPVATVAAMFADGISHAEVLAARPDLERDDIIEALEYADEAVRERELPLVVPRNFSLTVPCRRLSPTGCGDKATMCQPFAKTASGGFGLLPWYLL